MNNNKLLCGKKINPTTLRLLTISKILTISSVLSISKILTEPPVQLTKSASPKHSISLQKNTPTRYRGLTLVDLLISLAIITILISTAIPAMYRLIDWMTMRTVSNQLFHLVQTARNTALQRHQMITLCPTIDYSNCGGHWHQGILLFIDEDEDGNRAENEEILFINQALNKGSSLQWRAFGNKPYLQFTSQGVTNHQNGRFAYCPPSGDHKYKIQMVINRVGRPRVVSTKELKEYC